jgi:hypothetical protein
LIPRKNPAPPVSEIKQSHIQQEHPVVTLQGAPKNPRQNPTRLALRLIGFHF